MLAAHPQGFPARHGDLESRAPLEEIDDPLRSGHDLLEIVDQQQNVLVAQLERQRLERRLVASRAHADAASDGCKRGRRLPDRGQVDEEHTVRETVDLVRRRLEGHPRLADAAGTSEREQPNPVRVQQVAKRGQLRFAAEELRRLGGKVVRPLGERHERRKVELKRGMDKLEDALGPREVLEAVLAEVTKARLGGQVTIRKLGGRCRKEHLSSVARGHDPGGAVHGGAEEIVGPLLSRTDVDAHSDTQWARFAPSLLGQPALPLETRQHPVGGRREHGHQPVTCDLDDGPPGAIDGRPQDRVVTLHRAGHRVGKPLPHTSARLEIGEDERESVGRGPAHDGSSVGRAQRLVAKARLETMLG
jgi:hypothetical protein